MIAPHVVEQIRHLLAEGKLAQRKIARLVGVSRGTVGAISTGRRPNDLCRRPDGDHAALGQPTGPLERCPGCGGMVEMPCRLCQARSLAARSPSVVAGFMQAELRLGLELRPRERKRYEAIHARKLASAIESDQAEADDAPDFDEDEYVLTPAELWDALGFDDEEPMIEGLGDRG
ncbi:MAG TPA: helix-turn-helix transcriptional regulator [Thermoguttaceae bacterium]|nr:helix-turn-helix transcriptional regulator [Thermoguttaceae bacterium]